MSGENSAYHLLTKEIESLQRSHRLRTRLNISESYMRLSAHLVVPDSNDIKYRAIGRKEGV
jgi:hypothetical protein